ncbi:MAG: hypothetical protein H6Q67_770 [Firmicutes bacterium]|nr:hypothetical protein [Bacillota bacterium]
MKNTFLEAVKDRRSYYAINKEVAISDECILEIINHAVFYAPSAFNSQSARIVILLGSQHETLWNIAKDTLKKIIDPNRFAVTEEKINGFANGYGTVLFFENMATVQKLQNEFSLYKDNFPIWSHHASGMLQYIVWTAMESEGLGASLQHYNPLIDDEVKKTWNVPADYKLIAQMPFGNPVKIPEEKEHIPVSERVKLYK